MSWPLFAVITVVLALAVVEDPATLARRATTIAAVAAIVAVSHVISRADHPLLASWLLVIGLTVIVTQRAWITGGIHAPVAVFYGLFIVMGGALIDARAGLATAGVCLLGAILLTGGTMLGWLVTKPGAGSPLGAFVFVVLAIGIALVLQTFVALRPQRERLAVEALQMHVHDMRSPLQVLLAHLEFLKEDVRGESAHDVEGAIDGALRLKQMTTGMLDVGRLDAGRMPVQPSATDVAELARSVTASVQVLQPSREITVQTSGDGMCRCDPELTRRILENLVGNAMKHTALDGPVLVIIESLADRISIAVRDEGPGVPDDKRNWIFEPYHTQGLKKGGGHASSGLGLAFCRLAAEAQGGTIRIENAVPRGSIFIVELPC